MKGKKGIEITTSTLIIFILAVIALIAIAAFFMGGFGKIADTVKGIFGAATSGVSRDLAIQNCQQYCDRAQSLEGDQQPNSAYCTSYFNIDTDNNGEAQYTLINNKKLYTKFYCSERNGIDSITNTEVQNLGVSCADVDCKY